jgi:xylose isomerase
LSNPYNKYKGKAIDILIRCLKFGKDKGLHHCGVSPTSDGYLYSLGTLYYDMWDRYEDAIAIAMDKVPGVQVALEPKPYEPVSNGIYRTISDGLIVCYDIESRLKAKENKDLIAKGYTLLGMQPEVGHIRMGYEDSPYTISRIARQGRLFHVHCNSQPLGSYSQDLNTGVVDWQQTEAMLYSLKMVGYKGYFGLDLNPERIPVERAIKINSLVLNIMNDRINRLKHEEIIEAYFDPENYRGDIEIILGKNMK